MFLKKIKLFRKIGFRFAAIWFAIFTFSLLIIFVTLYLLLADALKEKDHQILQSVYKQYETIYQKNGASGIKAFFADEKNRKNIEVLIRIESPDGKTLFFHTPKTITEYNFSDVNSTLQKKSHEKGWIIIGSKSDADDNLEILSERLSDNSLLQVGKDTDDREETLERFRGSFLLIAFLSLILGLPISWFFSRRILLSLRDFVSTIRLVKSGKSGVRVPLRESGDELDALAVLFNTMLDKNERLILGMENSLDAVAHDLRTPLTWLRGIAETGLNNKYPPEAIGKFGEIIEGADQILELLKAVMDISDANSGAMKLKLEERDSLGILNEIVDLYGIIAEERNIKMNVNGEMFKFKADIRLKQALANLLDNAIKYSDDGKSVTLSATQSEGKTILIISDEGKGIPNEDLPHIWERLYRGDASRNTPGMGLGLSLVQAIIRAHSGSIEVSSILGAGSIFTIRL